MDWTHRSTDYTTRPTTTEAIGIGLHGAIEICDFNLIDLQTRRNNEQ